MCAPCSSNQKQHFLSFSLWSSDPAATLSHVLKCILAPLVLGAVFWQIDLSFSSRYDRVSAIAMISVLLGFFRYDIVNLFPLERAMFNRENTAGMYRPITFYIGRNIAEIPLHFILIWICGTIAYWMFGLQHDANKYLIYMLIIESLAVAAPGFMLMVSALAMNRQQANVLADLTMLMFALFDGNWVSLDKVPPYCKWIEYISCLRYAAQAMIANEYRGITFTCTQSEIDLGHCTAESGQIQGEQVLYNRGMDDVDIYYNIMMLWVLAFGYRAIGFLGVWLLYRPMSSTQIIKNTFGF